MNRCESFSGPVALSALDRGGTLALAGVHLTNIPPLDHRRHLLHEREIRSIEAGTWANAVDVLLFAGRHWLKVPTKTYRLRAALSVLRDLNID